MGVVGQGQPLFCHVRWLSAGSTQSSELFGQHLESKTRHRCVTHCARRVGCSAPCCSLLGVMGFSSQTHHQQTREERHTELNRALLSLDLWQKGTALCRYPHSAEGDGWGRLAEADVTVLCGGRRKEGRSGGCEEMSSPGASVDGGGGRAKAHLRHCRDSCEDDQRKCGILLFFSRTAKAVEPTVCMGEMSLEGAKKQMWDWEHLLQEASWKTTKQRHSKTEMLCCVKQAALGCRGREAAGQAWCKAGPGSAWPGCSLPQRQGRPVRCCSTLLWSAIIVHSSDGWWPQWQAGWLACRKQPLQLYWGVITDTL